MDKCLNVHECQHFIPSSCSSFPQGVECVINNAAYVPPLHTFVEGEVSEWERCVGVNVWGALHVTRALLPAMVTR